MIVYWDEGQERPWLAMTDHPRDEAWPCLYSPRFWIELGFFRAIEREGRQWQRTRRTDPDRVARRWLAMAVATLLSLGVGTRVEDARELGKDPSNLRKPPEARSRASERERNEVGHGASASPDGARRRVVEAVVAAARGLARAASDR